MGITPDANPLLSNTDKTTSIVGKDILAWCGRCKMNLMHTIVSLEMSKKPDYVLCNTCKSEHKFKHTKVTKSNVSNGKKSGGNMSEHEDELDLDQYDVSKVFNADEPGKKKAKSKAKAKKVKEDGDHSSSKSHSSTANLPLSMQSGTAEDLALFNTKKLELTHNPRQIKDYKISERFEIGDAVQHKTFGLGFIIAENGLNKAEVVFDIGRKLLIMLPK